MRLGSQWKLPDCLGVPKVGTMQLDALGSSSSGGNFELLRERQVRFGSIAGCIGECDILSSTYYY